MNQMNIDFDNILFIRAKGDSEYMGLSNRKYKVFDPYYGKGIISRLFREVHFRFNIPFKSLWYKKLPSTDYSYIIVFDPLITEDYLCWLKKKVNAKLIFSYGNLIGHARHIPPKKIPEGYSVFTYDENDACMYGIRLNNHVMLAETAYKIGDRNKNIDVTFIGTNKGREKDLRNIERAIQEKGNSTYFYIVPDRTMPFQRRNDCKALKYEKFLTYTSHSKCVLNYVYNGQTGVSLRDIEALANGIKLMTNNVAIKNKFFYDPENIFIVGLDDFDSLNNFLNSPFKKLSDEFKYYYSFEGWLTEFLNNV